MRKRVFAAGILLASAGFTPMHAAAPTAATVQAPPARTAADDRLKALYEGYAAWQLKEAGYFEDAKGETKPADYLEQVDPASQQRRAQHLQLVAARRPALVREPIGNDRR